jgi:hypothetical protein
VCRPCIASPGAEQLCATCCNVLQVLCCMRCAVCAVLRALCCMCCAVRCALPPLYTFHVKRGRSGAGTTSHSPCRTADTCSTAADSRRGQQTAADSSKGEPNSPADDGAVARGIHSTAETARSTPRSRAHNSAQMYSTAQQQSAEKTAVHTCTQ